MKITTGINDDYAIVYQIKGKYEQDTSLPIFYYGYESTIEEDGEWRFTVKINFTEVFALTTKELCKISDLSKNDNVEKFLIVGMFEYFKFVNNQ